MKKYKLSVTYENGNEMTFSYMQRKRIDETIELFKKNRLVHSMALLTQEYGEYERAGEYSEKEEVVWEKNKAAQQLGKLSAKARDTSSEAMRELVNRRWNK